MSQDWNPGLLELQVNVLCPAPLVQVLLSYWTCHHCHLLRLNIYNFVPGLLTQPSTYSCNLSFTPSPVHPAKLISLKLHFHLVIPLIEKLLVVPPRLPYKFKCPKVKSLSRVQFFVTPCTVAYQAPLSMGFSRQEYWNGLPFPSLGDLPNPGIEPGSPAL